MTGGPLLALLLPAAALGLSCSDLTKYLPSESCAKAVARLDNASCLGMLDACGKPPAGIGQGAINAFGSFDACAGYTSAGAVYAVYSLNASMLPLPPAIAQQIAAYRTMPQIGLCLPRACADGIGDSGLLFELKGAESAGIVNGIIPFGVDFPAGAVLVVLAVALLLAVSMVAAVVTMGGLPGLFSLSLPGWPALRAFSLVDNFKSLCDLSLPGARRLPLAVTLGADKRKATSALEGMRVLSMQWVVIGHTLMEINSHVDNPLYVQNVVENRWTMQTIVNGTYSVDTFFVLSGFLLAYVTLGKLARLRERQAGASVGLLGRLKTILMLVVHRWLRLVPSLGLVMWANAQLISYVGDGPFWPQVDIFMAETCRKYWWTNLLFINNLYPKNLADECVAQSWYLANDMQFFVFFLPILFAFAFWEPIRTRKWAQYLVVGLVAAASCAVRIQCEPARVSC